MIDLQQIEKFYPEPFRAIKKNILREYLQYKILEILFDSKYANKLAFMGGTAIRIVHGSSRFSEDLDFDNFDLTANEFSWLSEHVRRRLALEGYHVEIRKVMKAAFHCHIAFLDILYDFGLSPHKSEKLVIRLDTEPQGVEYEPDHVILNKFDVFLRIKVVPIDILLSQKLLAILKRKRTMGRDLYDTLFLFGRTMPNLHYLRAKARINDWQNLKERLLAKSREFDAKRLAKDVEPFLANPDETKKILLFAEYIKNLEFHH